MNVLAIGAHFDDVEIGCGGSLAKHVHAGDNVVVYVATKSGYKDADERVVRSDETAYAEGKKAIVETLGAKLICGSFKTLELEYSDEVFCELIKILKSNNIDLIYTHWYGDIHRDHAVLSKATMHVARHISRVLMYRSNWYDSTVAFNGNFYVDISRFYKQKEQAIRCHESEFNRIGVKWLDYFRNEAVNLGHKINADYAEVFEVVKWLEQ